ncbi:type VI secretion system protein TssA [Pseudomonas sp. RIT-PI-AD]|uniref:type VI secretion system protein TssA n=1 Tax=Pseudomonas sp. RIT-PI-AD TaxID=3035294 RepID=UPI0021D8DA6C|nr:type VI secretion system protein TssA [Pseudomonas sp. RIT-PI-AD]
MSLNVETLLAPIGEENPCGVELDYDADYLALERSVEGQPERQYGDTVIPAEEPDWSKVLQQALALLEKSKDFRLTVIATRALTHTQGVEGTVQGLTLTLEMAQRYWTEAYPSLAYDGESDPLPRSNALAGLTALNGLIGDLRSIEIASRQLGKLPLSTLERIAQSREDTAGAPLRRDQLEQFLADELAFGNPDLSALGEVKRLALELDRFCRDSLGAEHTPEFHRLVSLIDLICPSHLSAAQATAPAEEENTGAEGPPGGAQPEAKAAPGVARSRSDAIAMLDAVCDFLEKNEPANPAPLLIRRARNMIGQDFLSILRDLAPDGLAQAELIAGVSKRD